MMLCSAFFALFAVAAASQDWYRYEPDNYFTRRDFKNWHDIFLWQGPEKWTNDKVWALKKMCDMVLKQEYRNPLDFNLGLEELDSFNLFNLKNKPYGRKHLRDVQHCCNKISTNEKKVCFKEIRENYLDMMCDQGHDHVCCKNEYENRYTCFGKNLNRVKYPRVVYEDHEEIMSIEKPHRRRHNRLPTNELEVEEVVEESLKDLAKPEKHTYVERLDDARALKQRIATDRYGRMYDTVGDLGRKGDLLLDLERAKHINRFDRFNRFDQLDQFDQFDRFDKFDQFNQIDQFDRVDAIDRFDQVDELALMTGAGRRFDDVILAEEEGEQLGLSGNLRDRLDIVDERLRHRRCPHSAQCMSEVEVMTDVAAQKVCRDNVVKSLPRETESCCRAGALVGKTVGRKHREVCVPAVFNLQRKVQGCVLDRRQCKQAFVQCCHERAERARDERVLEKDLTREIVREEFEDSPVLGGFGRRFDEF